MSGVRIHMAIVILIFYVGLTIISSYALIILGTTWQAHDTLHTKTFNCTCLTETEYQCYQEAIRTETSIERTKCTLNDKWKYEFCVCVSHKKQNCNKCYVIERPVRVPKRCRKKICDAFDGLQMWMFAAGVGVAVGGITSVIMLMLLRYAVKSSENVIDIPKFHLINLLALVPPALVGYSLATTEVRKYYPGLELNTWSMVMAIGFGGPLCAGWTYTAIMMYLRKKNLEKIRNRCENDATMQGNIN